MTIQVRVLGTGQLVDLQRRLRRAGDESLRSSMQRRVRRAAEPLRDDLKSAIRRVPITGAGNSRGGGPSPTTRPLRATIANAIRISVRTQGGGAGARVWIDKGALPSDIRNLPEKINDGRWRHPVYDNRSRWTTSHSRVWWGPTVTKHQPRMLAEVARILNDVERRIGG